MKALLPGLRRFEQGVLVAALAGATLIPLFEALNRLAGFPSLPGSAAYVQHLTMWLAFVGGLLATREEKHLMLSTAEFIGEGRLRRAIRVATYGIAAATCAVLAYASWQIVAINRTEAKRLPIGLPEWTSELVMPVALVLMALRFTWKASPRWRGRLVAGAVILAAFALAGVPAGVPAEEARFYLEAGEPLPTGLDRLDLRWPLVAAALLSALIGAPVFVVMGSVALLLFYSDGTPVSAVSAEVYRLIASPALPAIPLLTGAGYVLAESQASNRLLRFFNALFGWLPGGLAVMVAAVCALFTTFTGGSGVTIIALGGLVLPMLLKERYPEPFSMGLVTASGSLGLLFPPSLPVILYSVVASARDQSVPAESLYLAGLLPGFLMLGLVAGYGMWTGGRVGIPRQRFAGRELAAAAWAAKWELALPVLVVALFSSGLTSMVETAAAALFYAVVVEVVITRDVPLLSKLPEALLKSSVLTGAVLILLSAAMGSTSYIVDAQVPEKLLAWVRTHIESPLVFLLALNALLIVVGCLVDIYSAIIVLAPLIAPIGLAFGVDPVHLGVIFLANLELGFLTPPVGLNLFLSSQRFGKPLLQVYRDTFPFLVILAIGVLLITYVPALSVGVLQLLGRTPGP